MPYTYLIGWSQQNKWYYGVRFGQKTRPSDLWKTYFTSSKLVKEFRQTYGEPDVVKIRRVFKTADTARKCETKVIQRLKLVESNDWLNQSDNTSKFYWQGKRGTFSEEHKQKLSEAAKKRTKQGRTGIPCDDKTKQILREKRAELIATGWVNPRKGKKNTEEQKRKYHLSRKGKKMSDAFKTACSERNKLRYQNPEARETMRKAQLKRFGVMK